MAIGVVDADGVGHTAAVGISAKCDGKLVGDACEGKKNAALLTCKACEGIDEDVASLEVVVLSEEGEKTGELIFSRQCALAETV